MKNKNNMINEMVKKDMEQKIKYNDVYINIRNKLNLNSIYEDIIELYKKEINYRMDSFFYGKSDNLDLSINFNNFYEKMMCNDEYKYRHCLYKKLQKVYENSSNFSCLIFFNNYNDKRKLYNLYSVLTIEELNKLKN